MASVRQLTKPNREGKRPWVVEYTDSTGKRRRETPPSGLKKDADRLRQKIERELDDKTHVAATDTLSLKAAYDIYFEDCLRRQKIGDLSGNTVHGIKYLMGLILPSLGSKRLTEVSIEVLQAQFDKLSATYSATSLKDLRSVVRTFLRFAVRRKYIKRNVLVDDNVRLPKGKSTKPPMPTKDEIAAILGAIERRHPTEHFQGFHARRVVVLLALFCGLRRGEIAGLQWHNVDFAKSVVRVRNSFSQYDGLKGPKTDAGERDVPMPPIVCDALMKLIAYWQLQMKFDADPRNREYKKRIYREDFMTPPPVEGDVRPCGYVVTTRDGQPVQLKNMSMDFVGHVMMKAGIPSEARNRLGLHSLRHAFVSLLIEDGIAPLSLMKLVGHASLTTTYNVYAHLFPREDAERTAVERIASGFNATRTRQIELSA